MTVAYETRRTYELSHLAWCALVAARLAQQEGKVLFPLQVCNVTQIRRIFSHSGRSLLMLLTMSNKDLHRLPVIQVFVEKHLHRCDAASQLDLTERQVQRLMNRFRESGAAGLTNSRRGLP